MLRKGSVDKDKNATGCHGSCIHGGARNYSHVDDFVNTDSSEDYLITSRCL